MTGFFWVGTYDAHADWARLSPEPKPDPCCAHVDMPTKAELLQRVANPENVYMACQTHGSSECLTTWEYGHYVYIADYEFEEAMKNRHPYRLVILLACQSGDGDLPDIFTKGLGRQTAVLACTDIVSIGLQKATDRISLFIDLLNDPSNRSMTLYELYKEAKYSLPAGSIMDDPWFYGDRTMKPRDIFLRFFGWEDLLAFADAYGSVVGCSSYRACFDFNNDGMIDWEDLLTFSDRYKG